MHSDYYHIDANGLGDGARIPILKLGDSGEVFYEMAQDMVKGIVQNNAAGKPTVYIVPVGPVGQYPIFVRLVNRDRVSLRNCWFINMDEYLADGGGYIEKTSELSFRGFMEREVYARISPELVMPEEQRIFPDPQTPGRIGEVIAELGGVDAVFGGVGLNGHVAFNEARPELGAEEFARLGTRVIDISPATFFSNAMGSLGGAYELMPRQAVTIGMKEILMARRIRIGMFRSWHRAVVRRAAYGAVGGAFPATLLQNHPDALLIVNQTVSGCPL